MGCSRLPAQCLGTFRRLRETVRRRRRRSSGMESPLEGHSPRLSFDTTVPTTFSYPFVQVRPLHETKRVLYPGGRGIAQSLLHRACHPLRSRTTSSLASSVLPMDTAASAPYFGCRDRRASEWPVRIHVFSSSSAVGAYHVHSGRTAVWRDGAAKGPARDSCRPHDGSCPARLVALCLHLSSPAKGACSRHTYGGNLSDFHVSCIPEL